MKLRAAQQRVSQVRHASFHDIITSAGHVGLGHLSGDDIVDSRKFLRKVFRRQLEEAEAGKRKLTVAGEESLQHLIHAFVRQQSAGQQARDDRVQIAASAAFSFACSAT